jgi:UDP-N-acetylmuramoyl-tripeptide--D-alanyl-D-alanine ligase
MTIVLTKDELLSITNGRSSTSSERMVGSGIVTDSRLATGGSIFIALRGEKEHGHSYVRQAYDRGAALVVVETNTPFDGVEPERVVVVPDTAVALQQLAGWWRGKLSIPLIGITGSVGKTTTKELCAAILLAHSQGSYSRKSFNNHVGVPLTLSEISPQASWAVVEMGMNHAGEIRALSQLARPTVALVTVIGTAHIENLGSIEAIARAKLEITEGMEANGTLILNGDDTLLLREYRDLHPTGVPLTFGTGPSATLQLTEVRGRGLDGLTMTLRDSSGATHELAVPIIGKHNALNVCAAILAAQTAVPALTWEEIALGLSRFVAPSMRLGVVPLPDGRRIVDDSYNANPASMQAMLDIAAETIAEGYLVGLVLGDMRELGDIAAEEHRAIGKRAAAIQPSFIVAVGPHSREIYQEALAAGIEAAWVETAEEAIQPLQHRPFEVAFVKASRGTMLDKVIRGVTGL